MKAIERFLLVFIVLLFLCPGVVVRAGDVMEVVGEGVSAFELDTTLAEVMATALNNARRNALEKAVGLEVRGSTVVYNTRLVNDLIVTATRGLIVEEKVLESEPYVSSGRIYYRVKILAKVKPLKISGESRLRILDVSIRKPGTEPSRAYPVFQNGDEIVIKVSVNERCHLYIFSVDQWGKVTRLLPNRYIQRNIARPEKEFVFPRRVDRELGFRLKANLPEGFKRAVESIIVIAVRDDVDFLKGVKNPTVTDLMRDLSLLPIEKWSQKTAGYEIRK